MDAREDKQLGYPRTVGTFEVDKRPVCGKGESVILCYELVTVMVGFYTHASFVLLADAARRSASSQFCSRASLLY